MSGAEGQLMTPPFHLKRMIRELSIGFIALIGSAAASLLVGVCFAAAIVLFFFSNTRADGIAVFTIGYLTIGVFISPMIFTFVMARRNKTWKSAIAASVPCLCLAAYGTYTGCKGAFITLDNWRWILSSGDGRNYELMWIIKGWILIVVAYFLGLLLARMVFMHQKRSIQVS